MKRIFVKSFLILIFPHILSCNQQEKINPNIVTIRKTEILENTVVYKDEEVNFNLLQEGNNTIFQYQELHFIYKKESPEILIVRSKDTIATYSIANNFYNIGEKKYSVYKLEELTGSIDGGLIHYFSPEIGTIITKSDTWFSFKEIINTPLLKEKDLEILKSCIYNDFELNPQKEIEIPSPPPNE